MTVGRKHTDAEVAARRAEVERMVARGEWTTSNIRALAARHGILIQTVYDDRAAVLGELRQSLVDPDRTRAKSDLLVRARELYRDCADVRENRATAARLLDFEARVVGAYEPLQVDLTHKVDALPDEDLARQILDPEAQAWARGVLQRAGEALPTPRLVLDVDPEPPTEEDAG